MSAPIGLTFYYGFEKTEKSWEREIQRLSACNIRYLLVQNFYWEIFLKDESYRERTRRFLDVCARNDAKCLLTIIPSYTDYGFPGHHFGIFAEPETRKIIRAASEVTKQLVDCKALFGYYIDDEPPWRWNIKPESWKDLKQDFEKTYDVPFPETLEEASERQKAAYMKWILRNYVDYVKRFKKAVKDVDPNLKITICFSPAAYQSGFIKVANEVDFILVDLYPGWYGDPILYNRSAGFYAKINRNLLRRPFVFILQGHKIILGHQPTPEEILRWSQEVLREGAAGLGWLASDFYGTEGRFRPTYHNSAERWGAVEKACCEMKLYPPEAGDVAVIVPLESAYHGAFDFSYLCYAYHFLRNTGVPFTFLGDYEAKREVLSDYKVVLLAGQKYACGSFLKSLEEYVQDGGTLVASVRDLKFDENGESLAPYLTKIFGIEELQGLEHPNFYIVLAETFGDLKKSIDHLSIGKDGCFLRVKEGVKVLGRDNRSNRPVIISSNFGKGEAYYIGTNMFEASLHASIGWKWHNFFKEIIDKTRYT